VLETSPPRVFDGVGHGPADLGVVPPTLRAYLQDRVSPKAERIAGIADFLEARLRRAMLQRADREQDVQDVVAQLLIGRGMERGLPRFRAMAGTRVGTGGPLGSAATVHG
jgi:hypothetical protein